MAEQKQLEFDVQGMTCASCAQHVQRALKKVPGVIEANVPGWESGQASVKVEEAVNPADLEASVAKAGYRASVKATNGQHLAAVPFIAKGQAGDHVHLMVIGGGSAGFAATIKGAELAACRRGRQALTDEW